MPVLVSSRLRKCTKYGMDDVYLILYFHIDIQPMQLLEMPDFIITQMFFDAEVFQHPGLAGFCPIV